MPVFFFLTSEEALTLKPGLPPDYNGTLLKGIAPDYTTMPFGYIVYQQFRTASLQIVKSEILWERPGRLLCQHKYPCVLFTRTTLAGKLQHYIKGTGRLYMRKDHFATLTTACWETVLQPENPGLHSFIDISWSPQFVREQQKNNPALFFDLLKNGRCHNFPERVVGASTPMNDDMKSILSQVKKLDFSATSIQRQIHQLAAEYLDFMLDEALSRKELKKSISKKEWGCITEAMKFIEINGDKHYTIPEISVKVGLNEYQLKKNFPQVTGHSVDEYRKYRLCIKAARSIVERPDEPLKNFYQEAGYTSLTTFIRGFKKLCCCTPGELRSSSWNLEGVGQPIDSMNENSAGDE